MILLLHILVLSAAHCFPSSVGQRKGNHLYLSLYLPGSWRSPTPVFPINRIYFRQWQLSACFKHTYHMLASGHSPQNHFEHHSRAPNTKPRGDHTDSNNMLVTTGTTILQTSLCPKLELLGWYPHFWSSVSSVLMAKVWHQIKQSLILIWMILDVSENISYVLLLTYCHVAATIFSNHLQSPCFWKHCNISEYVTDLKSGSLGYSWRTPKS